MSETIQENISLQSANTLALPAIARYYIELTDPLQLPEIIAFANDKQISFLVIGGGSNLILTDDFAGLVIKNNVQGVSFEEKGDDVLVTAAAGENWHQLVQTCLANNYYGLENLSLIPGSVGAAPIQNIGAYGVELADCFESLTGWHCDKKEWLTLAKEDCHFAYRESIFKQSLNGKFIITVVVLKLSKHATVKTSYKALNNELNAQGIDNPTPKQVAELVIAVRKSKLPDPSELPNVGSFFKNPIVSNKKADLLLSQYPDLVVYPLTNDSSKLAAGWLLEEAGWKGKREGDVGMHEKQSLVMINYAQANSSDVLTLANHIQADINNKFDIQLEIEPVIC